MSEPKALWREDDAGTPDRERLGDAWLRLFGERFDRGACLKIDDGDAMYFVHELACAGYECGLGVIYSLLQWRLIQLRRARRNACSSSSI